VTPPRKFLLVGLTGGIATGKSTVATTLRRLGAEVIDADQLARDVVAPGEPALAEIVREFGDVLLPDGCLDRKKLGGIVFNDAGRRARLEAITHPAIRARFLARLQALQEEGFEGLVFFDAPVMIESGNYRNMDRLVVVFTDETTQRARLMARDGMAAAEAGQRMATQMPVVDKAKLADYVIDNCGDRAATEARTREVYQALLADLRAREQR
jgi:dephospho-CoA kinase